MKPGGDSEEALKHMPVEHLEDNCFSVTVRQFLDLLCEATLGPVCFSSFWFCVWLGPGFGFLHSLLKHKYDSNAASL